MKQFLLIWLLSILLISCLGEEEYSSSPADYLTFSVDTLSMDTIIAGEGTNTYFLWAYNKSGKGLRINNIKLKNGKNSPFRVNVDGEYLIDGESSGCNILANDSLRIFVELTAPETDQDAPQQLEDELVFRTEQGSVSRVVLTASSQDVIKLNKLVVTNNLILDSKRPYQVFDTLIVQKGATLKLVPGTRLYFHSNAALRVEGTLIAGGTLEEPIVFRGDRMGNMFNNQPYDRIPAQWKGIEFASGSRDNKLNYCDIHSGTYGIIADMAEVRIENSVIHNMSGNCLTAKNSEMYVGNSQITNAGMDCLSIVGGSYMFVHCTIAGFYYFIGGPENGVALRFSNMIDDDRIPLNQLDFYNCIITGKHADEIMGDDCSTAEDAISFSYKFTNCLLCTPESEAINQSDCIWEDNDDKNLEILLKRDKHFAPAFDFDNLIFSFLPAEESRVVNSANFSITQQTYPFDRLGINRLTDNYSDMGCYEHTNNQSVK